jgi:hypothetical protein
MLIANVKVKSRKLAATSATYHSRIQFFSVAGYIAEPVRITRSGDNKLTKQKCDPVMGANSSYFINESFVICNHK